jgi:hypothetical protein
MKEIKCPKCGESFKVDEASFADIVKQVRDHEFENALHEQVESAVKIARLETEGNLKESVNQKEIEIARLQSQLKEKDDEAKLIEERAKSSTQEELLKKEAELADLKAKLDAKETENKLALTEAVNKIEKERDVLANELDVKKHEQKILESSLKERYEAELKIKDEQIAQYKDFKARQSVKLLGESLEQHCQNEFNNVRVSMFPFAYFEKDNEAVEGTKGDYIYRDYESKDGAEIISIMFEMKDEQDESVNKKTVESHLKKLDDDRKKKGCEYAILVTTLETDNELYNRGIVNVSYKYEKMFVIRPQFFLPLTSLLKEAGMKSAEDRRQLVAAKNSNIDLENFVENIETWKSSWGGTMKNAAKKHFDAIEQIDKAIKDLMKARDALTTSDKHLLAAENKLDDLTVRRLTKNAPSVAERLKEQEK